MVWKCPLLMGIRDIDNVRNQSDVGRTLLLGAPGKQNGQPVECFTLPTLISPPKRGFQYLWSLIYGLLPMAKLTVPLICVRDTGKVRNREWQNRELLLFLFLSKSLFHDSSFVVVDAACAINKTQLGAPLAVPFRWKKNNKATNYLKAISMNSNENTASN